jgi:cyclic pyranopterin phosphate synthase
VRDLALTTNGVLLAEQAAALKAAGLHRITVSLDTLRRSRFETLTRFDHLHRVLRGIEEAGRVFGALKTDMVVMRGVNDDELVAMIEFGKQQHAEVRFIEYMDVGGATRWTWDQVVTRKQMLSALGEAFGPPTPLANDGNAPADRYRLPDGTVFGIISSTTEPFCRSCDRARLTADGHLFSCLYAESGLDLRGPLRAGVDDASLSELIAHMWTNRRDRGAEDRLRLVHRTAHEAAVQDVHLQMHTRGG